MAEHWFRSYHGAPTDPKWIVIARMANTIPGVVAVTWWTLMDHASQNTPRGSVAGFDHEATAAFFGFDADAVAAIVRAFRSRSMIGPDDVLSAWCRRNPADYSTPRVQRYREMKRDETVGNGSNGLKRNETPEEMRGDERRGEKKKENPPKGGQKKESAKRKIQLPPDWAPNDKHRAMAKAIGVSVELEAEKMRDWAASAGTPCIDWDARFRNWLRNAKPSSNKPHPDSPAAQIRDETPGRGRRETSSTSRIQVGDLSPNGMNRWDGQHWEPA